MNLESEDCSFTSVGFLVLEEKNILADLPYKVCADMTVVSLPVPLLLSMIQYILWNRGT
jgi:N6-adenosine-specific RNA methylase IME4